MPLKRQTIATIEAINSQIKAWLRWQDLLREEKYYTDRWYALLRERNACYSTIINLTGMTADQAYDIIYNKTNTSSYWLANGQIRKEHP
jgi:hypothetical protein